MILAVHISDAVLRPDWLAVGWLLALLIVALGMRTLQPEELPRLAIIAALFFMASSIHIPIGVGRVHLLLTGLVGIMAGRRSGLVILVGMTLQNRLIGHGGLLTIGFNTTVMSIPAIFIGLLFRGLAAKRQQQATYLALLGGLAGMSGVVLTVVLSYAGLYFGAQPEWQSVTWAYMIAHIPVVVVETIVTSVVVCHLQRASYTLTNDDGVTSSSGNSH
jgi:cobalt/nickel transport system permease protein